MADPRFYDNRGPFRLSEVCQAACITPPEDADLNGLVHDVAGLAQAGPAHLSFFDGGRRSKAEFLATRAGWSLVPKRKDGEQPKATVLIPAPLVSRAFADVAAKFYPEHEIVVRAQEQSVHPTARIGEGVVLGPGVIIGPGAEIGEYARIGAHAVIGRG